MPDPTRPTPGRRLNQGALVVILSALMLVNLATVGLLVMGGALKGDPDATDDVPVLTQVEQITIEDDGLAGGRAERDRERATAVKDVTASPAQPDEELATSEPETPAESETPAPVRPRAEPRDLPRVAERTPDPTPVIDADPEPALPPVEFFGIPVFE